MKPLFYILHRTMINWLKELRRRPAILIIYLFFITIFGLNILINLSNKPPFGIVSLDLYEVGVTALVSVIVWFGLKKGISGGNSFFRMSDVNLVFTTPVSPQKALVYGFIKQLMQTFFLIILLAFQIPTLRNVVGVHGVGLVIIYVAFLLLFLSIGIIGMLVYSLSSISVKWKKGLNILMNVSAAISSLLFLYAFWVKGDLPQAAIALVQQPAVNYIPFIGWYKVILMAAVQGVTPAFYIYSALLAALYTIMLLAFFRLKTDYYEDVLAATETKETLIAAKREGKAFQVTQSAQWTKMRKVNLSHIGTGARAIFSRHMLEYKKTGYFFINKGSLGLAVYGMIFAYFQHSELKFLLINTLMLQIIFMLQGKWSRELDKPYIYLIPASSGSKLFYATATDLLKSLVDGFIVFIASGLILHASVIDMLLCGLAYASFGIIIIYTDVMVRRYLGPSHSKQLETMIRIMLMIFIVLPGMIAAIVLGFIFKDSPYQNLYFFAVLYGYNTIVAAALFASGRGVFDKLEMR